MLRSNHGSRIEKIVAKTSYPVLQIDKVGNIVNEFPSTSELRKLGFSPSHISECCNDKRHTAYGYIWIYKKDKV